MICKHCGAQIPDNATFCTNCGNAVEQPQPQPQYQQPAQPQYQQPVYQPAYAQPAPAQPNILIFGILSIALSWTFIVGLIMGIVGRSKGKAFVRAGGTLTGASKVGYILSLVGIIASIAFVAYWVLYIILLVAGAASGALFNY